jgi:hypothetical protein
MKLNSFLLFYISYTLSAPQDKAQAPVCISKMECKMNDIFEKMKTDKNFMQCTKLGDDEDVYNCVYKAAGLRDDQTSLLSNLMSTSYSCGPDSDIQFKNCISRCASSKPCMETCADKKNENSMECVANKLKINDFDAKKSVQCSKKCTQDTLSEIIDCDMKCNEPIYKKFEDTAKDSKSDSEDKSSTNSTTTKSNSEDSKPTGSTNSSSTESSSGVASLSAGLFTIISIPILITLI